LLCRRDPDGSLRAGGDGLFLRIRQWDGSAAAQPARDIGAGAFRVTLHWNAGESDLTSQDIADLSNATAGTTGLRLVLAVYSSPASAPQDDASRTQFCTFAKNAVARFSSIDDVVIWSEPNVSAFWRPQSNADGFERSAGGLRGAARPVLGRVARLPADDQRDRPGDLAAGKRHPNAASNISHSPVNFIERMGGDTPRRGLSLERFLGQSPFGDSPWLSRARRRRPIRRGRGARTGGRSGCRSSGGPRRGRAGRASSRPRGRCKGLPVPDPA